MPSPSTLRFTPGQVLLEELVEGPRNSPWLGNGFPPLAYGVLLGLHEDGKLLGLRLARRSGSCPANVLPILVLKAPALVKPTADLALRSIDVRHGPILSKLLFSSQQ